MTYLIAKSKYNNEERGEEFSPTHFVLDINRPIIKYLHNLLRQVKKISKKSELIECSFHFGFGIWTEFDEWLLENCQEEVCYIEDLPIECQGQGYLNMHHVTLNRDGDLRFECYGKFDDERIYTCGFNLFELQIYLENRLMES